MSTVPTSDTRNVHPEPSFAAVGHVSQASRIVVSDDGQITVSMYRDGDDEALARIVIGPVCCLRIAHDLTAAALRRYGRVQPEESR